MIRKISTRIQGLFHRAAAPAQQTEPTEATERKPRDSLILNRRRCASHEKNSTKGTRPRPPEPKAVAASPAPSVRQQANALMRSEAIDEREEGLRLFEITDPDAHAVEALMESRHPNVRDYALHKYVELLGIEQACARLMVHMETEDEPVIQDFAFTQAMVLIHSKSPDTRERGLRLLDRTEPCAPALEELTHSPYGVVRDYAIRNYVRAIGPEGALHRLMEMNDDDEPVVRAFVQQSLDSMNDHTRQALWLVGLHAGR